MNIKELFKNYSKNDVFLLAVSGGPDSMAMLDMLKDSPVKLVVCNVNYKTRKESDYEEKMVERFALEHNMIFESSEAIENEISNFQDSARVFRYAFFKKIYEKYNAVGLFVAHNLDDSLETYILQNQRHGIVRHYGISDRTVIMGMNIFRPLLKYRKIDLLNYCLNNEVPYSIDYTNNLPKYERNKIRLDIINKLSDEEFDTLVKEMEEKEKENKLLFLNVENYLDECLEENKINLNKFKSIPKQYKTFVLYMYLEPRILRSSRVLSKKFLNELVLQIENSEKNKKYELNHKYYLFQEYDYLHVERIEELDYCYYLNKGEEIETPYFIIKKTGDNKDGIYIRDDEYPIMIRNYKDGDVINLQNGHKKVRRWFIDKKIPLSKRKKIPLMFTKQGKLVFIPSLYKDFERKNLKSNTFMIE